jgi:type III restriction enzyme
MHDYVPDFLIRLKSDKPLHLILETKGYDPLEEVKRSAAERWAAAVNADGTHGRWSFAMAKKVSEVPGLIASSIAN